MEELKNMTVGSIVAGDFRTAGIFSAEGIDFCCGGKQSLADACLERGLDINQIEQKLAKATDSPVTHTQNFNDWELDFLCDFIENTHHKYVIKRLPELLFYTRKIAGVHGEHHPELWEVSSLFQQIHDELNQHLQKEEKILFPAVRSLVRSGMLDESALKEELNRLGREHEVAGNSMDEIHRLTNGYKVPGDACNTYTVALKLLKEFEDDLHIHVHLENNILFPKLIKLIEK